MNDIETVNEKRDVLLIFHRATMYETMGVPKPDAFALASAVSGINADFQGAQNLSALLRRRMPS